jgi:hypothetical protein
MASAGTLLSDLDGGAGGGGGDGDLVQKILADMNVPVSGGQPGGRPVPPPLPASLPPQMMPMAGSQVPITMDRQIPTSHMIGSEQPTPADFAAAMVGLGGQRQQEYALAGSMGQLGAPAPGTQPMMSAGPTKNLYGKITDELKVPFVVAVLFFIFSLPPIRVLFAHYLPRFLRPTGEFTVIGLLVVSALVGGLFWVLHRVIAPLLSL